MWEGALFALQILGFWLVVYWMIRDEKLGGQASTGFFAVREAPKPAVAARPGDRRRLMAPQRSSRR
jgi:hypothetical protein